MSSTLEGLRMPAPAKINLGLEVIRRRSDGFHDINTIFLPVDLYDHLRLRPLSGGRIELNIEGAAELDAGPSNLCTRAAVALRERLGRSDLGLEITLTKRIPMGAGLGGGSSDAAAVLLGAAGLWGYEDLDHAILAETALSLGSDVPFFLNDSPAQASSRGEQLVPLGITLPWTILLVNPGIHVPTPWAYGAIARTGERAATDLPGLLAEGIGRPELLRDRLVNDFEPPVFARNPILADIKRKLYEAGAHFALMSGSGSTMYGLFDDDAAAGSAAALFESYWTVVAHQTRPAGSAPVR